MTGPEHYKRAEKLAADALTCIDRSQWEAAGAMAAAAQVHATLALAAATAQKDAGALEE